MYRLYLMQKSTILSVALSLSIIGIAFYAVSDDSSSAGVEQVQNVEIRDGVQYVTITARGGYFPRVSEIKEGIPTKLIVQTSGTYDCSAALVIRSAGFQKILQPTGEEVIDLGVPQSGQKIQGVCGMGMYNFQVNAR